MNRLTLVEDDPRLGLHGHDFKRANRSEVAQPAVSHGPDTARAAAQKSAYRSLGDG